MDDRLEVELKKYYGEAYDKKTATTVLLASAIARYAHRNQKRKDGSEYIMHPASIAFHYQELVGIADNTLDEALLVECGIPYTGVIELAWLHDVVEDTGFTFDEIRYVFSSKGFGDYYDKYIDEPLRCITKGEEESYPDYIPRVLSNINSSMVKILDLDNNLYPFSLPYFNDHQYERMLKYVKTMKTVNDKYHFIEAFDKYHKAIGRNEKERKIL